MSRGALRGHEGDPSKEHQIRVERWSDVGKIERAAGYSSRILELNRQGASMERGYQLLYSDLTTWTNASRNKLLTFGRLETCACLSLFLVRRSKVVHRMVS